MTMIRVHYVRCFNLAFARVGQSSYRLTNPGSFPEPASAKRQEVSSHYRPGAEHVFRLERHVNHPSDGRASRETVYGITGLCSEHAGPKKRVLTLMPLHWGVGKRPVLTRAHTLREDRSQLRAGDTRKVMAAINYLQLV